MRAWIPLRARAREAASCEEVKGVAQYFPMSRVPGARRVISVSSIRS